jgi:hypothetical protein
MDLSSDVKETKYVVAIMVADKSNNEMKAAKQVLIVLHLKAITQPLLTY